MDTSAINLNKLIDGSSVNRPNGSNAIAIQDLVKRLNGSGLKVTYIFFLLLLKMMADILKFTDTPINEESIEEYECRKYGLLVAPILITAVISELVLNRKMCPSESYLIFEGRLTNADDTAYASADEVALTNNAIMNLLAELTNNNNASVFILRHLHPDYNERVITTL